MREKYTVGLKNERKVYSRTKICKLFVGVCIFLCSIWSKTLMVQVWRASLNGLVLLVGVVWYLWPREKIENRAVSPMDGLPECWEIMGSSVDDWLVTWMRFSLRDMTIPLENGRQNSQRILSHENLILQLDCMERIIGMTLRMSWHFGQLSAKLSRDPH